MGFYVYNSISLYIWINTLYYVSCYERLLISNRTVVVSSSIYRTGYYSGDANKTVDRNFSQRYVDCMHTAPGMSEAWLLIDLGDVYNLKSVKIWYRNDRGMYSTRRLRGFSIIVSSANFDVNDTCYQDPGNVTLESVLEVNCFRTARYVKIFTNKVNDAAGAFLEICEVEIFGCPRKKYGVECGLCDRCKGDCDITGQCDKFGCLHNGYIPPLCTDCGQGKYGRNCNITCGRCFGNMTCNSNNGRCPSNKENKLCEPGWKHTLKCDEECRPGTYGSNCEEKCGQCEGDKKCNHINGSCPGSCEPGYHGEKCLKTLPRVMVGSSTYTGINGKSVALICSLVSSNPTATAVIWEKDNGGKLTNVKNLIGSRIYGGTVSQPSLIISSLTRSDTGTYYCSARNSVGTGSRSSTSLTVLAINQTSKGNSNTDFSPAFYGVITILFLSIFLNIFFIVRNVRKTGQSSKKTKRNQNSKGVADRSNNETVEDNAGYQDLGELTQPTLYEKIDRVNDNASYQELGQLSQPSPYEKLKINMT